VRHFIVHTRRAGHVVTRPLNCGSKDFPLESTLQRFDVVQRGTDCKSLIGLC
jgi:hypothetical protein